MGDQLHQSFHPLLLADQSAAVADDKRLSWIPLWPWWHGWRHYWIRGQVHPLGTESQARRRCDRPIQKGPTHADHRVHPGQPAVQKAVQSRNVAVKHQHPSARTVQVGQIGHAPRGMIECHVGFKVVQSGKLPRARLGDRRFVGEVQEPRPRPTVDSGLVVNDDSRIETEACVILMMPSQHRLQPAHRGKLGVEMENPQRGHEARSVAGRPRRQKPEMDASSRRRGLARGG